jgi:hypothetical protein
MRLRLIQPSKVIPVQPFRLKARTSSYWNPQEARPSASAIRCCRNERFCSLPELPIDEARRHTTHEGELCSLARMNFQNSFLKRGDREFNDPVRAYQSNARAVRKIGRHLGPNGRRHDLDDFNAGSFELKTKRLRVGMDRGLGSAVNRQAWQWNEGERGGRSFSPRASRCFVFHWSSPSTTPVSQRGATKSSVGGKLCPDPRHCRLRDSARVGLTG